jgi:hypothetical protein
MTCYKAVVGESLDRRQVGWLMPIALFAGRKPLNCKIEKDPMECRPFRAISKSTCTAYKFLLISTLKEFQLDKHNARKATLCFSIFYHKIVNLSTSLYLNNCYDKDLIDAVSFAQLSNSDD